MSLAPARPRRRNLAALAATAAVGLLAALLPAAVGVAPSSAAPVVPATPTFGPGIEALASYEGQVVCSPAAKAGATKLAALLKATYGSYSVGISRSCSIGAQSEHKEGRAVDWMVNVKVSSQRAKAESFLTWLLAPDADGNAAAMARRLGVMYIGWNDRMWRAYDPGRGWAELRDCLSNPAKRASGYDTECHRNHVHLSLSWDGAAGLTSFWTGTALPPDCRADWGVGYGATTTRSGDLVPVTPVRVASTRYGEGACRLSAPGWSGSNDDLVVDVTGKGEVPAEGVGAVAVRVTVSRPSAVTPTVSVRGTESASWQRVVTSPSTSTASGTAVVPVGSDGSIRVGVDRGGVDVSVDVLGWAPALVAPSGAAAVAGTARVITPAYVLDLWSSPLAPGASRTVDLAGRYGVPAGAASTLAISLLSRATTGTGSLTISAAPGATTVATLRTSSVSRVTQTLLPTPDGRVTVTNTGKVAVPLRLRLQGVWSASVTDGRSATILAAPSRVIDTISRIGLPGVLPRASWTSMQLTGRTVPTGAAAALLTVSVRGGTSSGLFKLGGAGTVIAASSTAGAWTHETVLVPLTSTGDLRLYSATSGTNVRVSVVGYVA